MSYNYKFKLRAFWESQVLQEDIFLYIHCSFLIWFLRKLCKLHIFVFGDYKVLMNLQHIERLFSLSLMDNIVLDARSGSLRISLTSSFARQQLQRHFIWTGCRRKHCSGIRRMGIRRRRDINTYTRWSSFASNAGCARIQCPGNA